MFPSVSSFNVVGLQNGKLILDTTLTTAATIAAALTVEPPVGSIVLSPAGIFEHISAGTAAANWSLLVTASAQAGLPYGPLTVINKTGAPIAANKLVAVTGASGGVPTIALADADTGKATHVTTAAIADNATGTVYQMVYLTAQDTSSVNAAGDPVYLDTTTAGGWVAAAPNGAGDFVQIVGYAETDHASTGKLLLCPGLTEASVVASG